jgi:hypothetical protein
LNSRELKEKIISELGLTHSSLVLRPSETIHVGKYYEFMAGSKPAKLILESVNWGMTEPNCATFTILINNGEPDA